MIGDKKELVKHLTQIIPKIKRKKNVAKDIKTQLENNDIPPGLISNWLSKPEETLPTLEIRELFLITEQVFLKSGDMNINPENYFTDVEIKESRVYSASVKREVMDFPRKFENATVVGNNSYMITLDTQSINLMLENQLLEYDFELQRETVLVKTKSGEIRPQPKLVKKNVDEIEEHLLDGTLVPTVLVFNAMTRSSETGDELIFDAEKRELTITKGTKLAIVDGFHRCKATQKALQKNPDLNFNFAVLITNYSKKKAQQYQAQLAKATPISKVRVQELEANRFSDTVVQQLKEDSDLKGKISQTNQIRRINDELVSYNVLADTIDEQFKMSTRADAADVGDYLVEFFNILLGSYSEEFLENPAETRKTSLINDNNMFVGYIVMARKMYENGIKAKDVRKIVKNIDFSKENKTWVDLHIIDNEGRIERDTVKLRRNIKNYFENLNLVEMIK